MVPGGGGWTDRGDMRMWLLEVVGWTMLALFVGLVLGILFGVLMDWAGPDEGDNDG